MWGLHQGHERLRVRAGRGRRLQAVLSAVSVVSLAVLTQSAAAAVGDLTPAGCIGNTGTGPASCIGTDGLDGADSVAVSADNKSVYVTSRLSRAVVVFRRAANGDLTPAGCFGNTGTGPASCIGTVGLDGADSVAVSPDNKSVYVASGSDAVVVFRRAANGDLTPAGCIGNTGTGPTSCIGTDGLEGANSVAVSPDNKSVYVASARSNAVVVFRRAANGDLTPAGCIGNTGTGPASCIGADGLDGAWSVAVSPDNKSVYVASVGSDAVVVFRRAANGDLTPAGCFGNTGTGPASCIGADGLEGADSVAVSPDNRSVYVASVSSNAVVVFRRAANGDLTPAGCIGNTGTGPASCIGADGLEGADSVAVSPDNNSVYVTSNLSRAVVVFRRAANGDLTPAGCIGNTGTGPTSCTGTDGLNYADSVAVSPDDNSVYVASWGSNAVVVFRRATSSGGGGGRVGRPTLSQLKISPHGFLAAASGGSATSARTHGARVTFRLDIAARVGFTVQQSLPGRRQDNGRCVRPTGANRGAKSCRRILTFGSFTVAGRAGANGFHFTGRANGQQLAPGSYTLVAVPSASRKKGNKSSVSFRIDR